MIAIMHAICRVEKISANISLHSVVCTQRSTGGLGFEGGGKLRNPLEVAAGGAGTSASAGAEDVSSGAFSNTASCTTVCLE